MADKDKSDPGTPPLPPRQPSPPQPPAPDVDESIITTIERGGKPDIEKRDRSEAPGKGGFLGAAMILPELMWTLGLSSRQNV